MKKIFSFLFSFILITFGMTYVCHPLVVYADDTDTPPVEEPEVTVDAELQAKPMVKENKVLKGQTFNVEVSLRNSNGLSALLITMCFDHYAFKLTNVEQGTAFNRLSMSSTQSYDFITTQGGYNILFVGSGKNNRDYGTGLVVTYTFECVNGVKDTDYHFDVLVDDDNTLLDLNNHAYIEDIGFDIRVYEEEYVVKFQNYDGTVLTLNPNYDLDGDGVLDSIVTNEDISIIKAMQDSVDPKPSCPTDNKYSYTFNGWRGIPYNSTEKSVIILEADYLKTPVKHVVEYYIDGLVLNEEDADSIFPDGIFNQNDFYKSVLVNYGDLISIDEYPNRAHYRISNWFLDEAMTIPFSDRVMGEEDIKLYCKYIYNIRDINCPNIEGVFDENETEVDENGNKYMYLNIMLTNNTRLSSINLATNWDKDNFELVAIDGREIFTDADLTYFSNFYDYDNNGTISPGVNSKEFTEPFQMLFYLPTNSKENGRLIRMKFKVKTDAVDGLYEVKLFLKNESHDATYYETDNTEWYSNITFINGKLPLGLRRAWDYIDEDEDINVHMESQHKGFSFDVELLVALQSKKIANDFDQESLSKTLGENSEIKDIYDIKLIQNGVEIIPDTELTVKIKLTPNQINSKRLTLYYVNDEGKLQLHESRVQDGYLIFTTNHLSHWLIIGDIVAGVGMSNSAILAIGLLTMLSIATISLVLILINKHHRELSYMQKGITLWN